MRSAPTVGILLPFVSGDYYGALVSGASLEASTAGVTLVALQTQEANACDSARFSAARLRCPVSWDLLDGFVVTIDAADEESINRMYETGKPIVLAGFSSQSLNLPVVLSDNHVGLRAAVESLIADGHTDIAFVGCMDAADVVERHAVYEQTLWAAGLRVEQRLCYRVSDNSARGGLEAAERMVAAGIPSTAAVCGCDRNAIGLMHGLNAAGYRVPEHQAVIGFDDIDSAPYHRPSLSTVRQYPESMGSTAVRSIIKHLRTGDPIPRMQAVATTFVRRDSSTRKPVCATRDGAPAGMAELAGLGALAAMTPIAELTNALVPLGETVAPKLTELVDMLVDSVDAAVADRQGPTDEHIRMALQRFFATETVRESPSRIAAILRRLATQRLAESTTAAGPGGEARIRVSERLHDLALLMADEYGFAQQVATTTSQEMFIKQYRLCVDLLRSHRQQPRQLHWLRSTPFRAGCLGVWTCDQGTAGSDEHAELEILSLRLMSDEAAAEASPIARTSTGANPIVPALSFPPRELCEIADPSRHDVVYVAPVKLDTRNWGMLATVGRAASRYGASNEFMNHSVAMLAVALDYEEVLSSLRAQEERMRRMALFDDLTGLPNRSLFLDRLRSAILRAQRQDSYQYGVLFLDVDGFKVVNDSLGHAAGDILLIQIAKRVRSGLRSCDTAARFGGDEFLVLLDGIDGPSSPTQVAERLQQALAQPFNVHGQDLFLTASIGIALGDSRYDNADDIMRDADLAMYTAKSARRGSHTIFNIAMHAQAVKRLELEAGLRQALERDEFEVHYQPIIDLSTGRAAAAEALIRWRHPSRGLIPPYEFLTVAEDTGLIVPMGRKIMADACAKLGEWHRSGLVDPQVGMSVNLSNKEFWHDDLLATVDACLADADIAPQYLALEITEGVIMHNVDQARKRLMALHERGIDLHIDDFGTGYSSLEALHQLPIDALKIDRSFVARLGVDQRSAELVRTIVLMGRGLGIRVIAEGIETPEHRDQVYRLDCFLGQGYWFSKPVAGSTAAESMAKTYPAYYGDQPDLGEHPERPQ